MNLQQPQISEFCAIGSGGTPSRAKAERYYGGSIPWVKSGELKANLILETEEHVTQVALQETAVKLVPRGAILVAMYGATVGQVAMLGMEATTNQAVCHIVPDEGLADPWYVFHYLRSRLPEFLAKRLGGAQPNISQQIVKRTRVPLPPLPEQRRIAAILDKADAIRRKRRQAIQLTEELLRSAFLDLFGDPVTNPKGWESSTIGEISGGKRLIVDGPFGSSLKPECYVESGVRVIRNFNIKPDRFDNSEFKFVTSQKFLEIKRSEVLAGDILISTKGTIGNVCVMPAFDGSSVLSASGTVRIRLPKESPVIPEIVVAQMISDRYQQYIRGFEAGSNQKYLNLTGIKKMRLMVPPISLQHRFRKLRAAVWNQLENIQTAQNEFIDLSNSLVHRAFSGRL